MSEHGDQTGNEWRAWTDAVRDPFRAFWTTTNELLIGQQLAPLLEVVREAAARERTPDPAAMHQALAPLRAQLDQTFQQFTRTLDWARPLHQAMQPDGPDDASPPPAWLRPWLDLVSARLGPWHEQQARQQQLIEAGLDYQAALADYTKQVRQSALEALDRLVDNLATTPLEAIDMHQLEARYLEAAEQAWEARIATTAYRQAFASVSNAGLAYTRSLQTHLDHWLGLLDLPTRRGLQSTQRRLHELRRAHRALATEMDADVAGLRDEVRSLREEVRRLKAASEQQSQGGRGA